MGKNIIRTGIGYDVHKLMEKKPLILGGVKIKHTKGLLGHSDADVLTHAIIDAILGALGKGDIGRHFPDSDPSYKGINSLLLLKRVMTIAHAEKFVVNNLDATIVAQNPKLSPYINQMEQRLSSIINVDKGMVNIKATTSEGIGFCGREEGMAAYAIVTLVSE